MSQNQKHFFIFIFFISILFYAGKANSKTLVYKTIDQGKEYFITFTIEESKDGFLIKTNDSYKDEMTYNTDQSFSVLKWKYINSVKGTDFSAERTGNRIFLKGKHNNEDCGEEFKIDNIPWYQEWIWGLELRKFVNSDKDSVRFAAIDKNRLMKCEVEAKKDKTEMIRFNDEMIETIHVKISLKGWKKIFWSGGEMWFRKSDGICILEKMNPEDPDRMIKLIGEK